MSIPKNKRNINTILIFKQILNLSLFSCGHSQKEKLTAAVTGENILYVISEKEHLPLLPEGALRILVTADLELIKSRFAQRMRGNLPAPVAAMLEKEHGCFDAEQYDIDVVSGKTDLDAVVEQIKSRL